MKNNTLIISTRKSPLALWQANFVKAELQRLHPELQIELKGLVTQGDKDLTQPLVNIGGKSLFVKELQRSLIEEEADIAVHCIKDMSVHPYPGLTLACILKRGDPRDVLVSNQYSSLAELPEKAVIGTSSPRRESLVRAYYPHLQVAMLRGNVNTRLRKLDDGEYDAIILASAGLHRLEMSDRIKEYLPLTQFIPAIGQGALGIECRIDDEQARELVRPLHDEATQVCVTAERAVNKTLGGDCHTPVGAYAIYENEQLHLAAMVGSTSGDTILFSDDSGNPNAPEALGLGVADALLMQGAAKLLNAG